MTGSRVLFLTMLVGIMAAMTVDPVMAAADEGMPHRPFGGYCQEGRSKGYGAKIVVETREDAARMLERYYADKGLRVGTVGESDHPRFYRAQIYDADDQAVDIVIIDRRTGRIRSID